MFTLSQLKQATLYRFGCPKSYHFKSKHIINLFFFTLQFEGLFIEEQMPVLWEMPILLKEIEEEIGAPFNRPVVKFDPHFFSKFRNHCCFGQYP